MYQDKDGDFQLVYNTSGETTELDLPLDGLVLPAHGAVEIGVVAVAMKNADYVGHLATSLTVSPTPYPWSEIRWCSPAVDLLAHFALREGSWTADKVRVIKEVFSDIVENDRDEFEALRDRLKLSSRPSIEECLNSYQRRFKEQPLVMGLMEGVAGLISLSGRPQDVVSAELHQLGRRLGATEPMVEIALAKSRQSSGKETTASTSDVRWARQTLGVTDGATQDEIKLAWRKKVSELHPDRYADLPEVVQNLIKTKAQELNRARDILKSL